MFKYIYNLIFNNPKVDSYPKCKCGKDIEKGVMTVRVFGYTIQVSKSLYCKECTELILNKSSILCDVCKKPILPCTPYGQSHKSEEGKVHYTLECSLPGSFISEPLKIIE